MLKLMLQQWHKEVSSAMGHLSQPLLRVLVCYSFGVAVLQHCGQNRVASLLGLMLGCRASTVKSCLREFTYEREAKRGKQRSNLVVSEQFAPLLRWVISRWSPKQRQLVLAADATYLGERFMVLCISVVYAGTAIPVAWRILRGNEAGAWRPIWQALLAQLAPAVPPNWSVYVLTDRGISAKSMYDDIVSHGWHPLLRIRPQGLYRCKGDALWHDLKNLPQQNMPCWAERVACYKGDPIHATLSVTWEPAYQEPCLLLTDLHPDHVKPNLYHLRAWIEAGFKDLKRGGFHWEQTKITDPQRTERLWLVLTFALLLTLAFNNSIEHLQPLLDVLDVSLGVLVRGQVVLFILLTSRLRLRPLTFKPYDFDFDSS